MSPFKHPGSLVALCLLLVSCAHGGKTLEQEKAFRAYYQGLIEQDKTPESRALFETALASANPHVVGAAAEMLVLPLLQGDLDAAAFLERRDRGARGNPNPPLRPLIAAALYKLDRREEIISLYGSAAGSEGKIPAAPDSAGVPAILDSWDRALLLLARQGPEAGEGQQERQGGPERPARENLLSFLLEAPPGPPLSWAAAELRLRFPDFLSGSENSALEGRLATARSLFTEGLARFRPVLDEEPDLFPRYPALITDLGRCFQFSPSGNEGIEVFLAWESELAEAGTASGALRYQLLYFAGRIARAQGDYGPGAGLFERALAFAPDETQEDACLWYILDTRLREEAGNGLSGQELVNLVKTWMPRRHDPSYFSDILDRIAQRLASSGQWRFFPELLAFLEQYGDPLSIARYAYISGRALSLGLIPAAASGGEGAQGEKEARREAQDLFRIAYNTGARALYYRAMSAWFLGEPFLDLDEETGPRKGNFPHQEEMSFLLGFFEEGIPMAAEARIEALAGKLTLEELQALGEAMEKAGAYAQAIRTASACVNRDDYRLRRRDLELLSPRPFRELIEGQARQAGLAPELLYGLIRTESAFQPEIASRAGAIGLVQLMPPTAADMAGRMKRRGGPDYTENLDLRDPEISIAIGAYYLNYLRDLLDHPLSAILAYNGGLGRVRRWRQAQPGLPGDLFLETVEYPETREYGRKIISAAALYGYLYYGVNPPSFLADICG